VRAAAGYTGKYGQEATGITSVDSDGKTHAQGVLVGGSQAGVAFCLGNGCFASITINEMNPILQREKQKPPG
jgi:hypothetical protein